MTISAANADAYFAPGNHSQAEIWLKFTAQHRAGAVATARRMFEREFRRALDDSGASDTISYREDYAVYEQALWILLGTPFGDGSGGDAVAILSGETPSESTAGGRKRDRWNPDAIRWLGGTGASTVRG